MMKDLDQLAREFAELSFKNSNSLDIIDKIANDIKSLKDSEGNSMPLETVDILLNKFLENLKIFASQKSNTKIVLGSEQISQLLKVRNLLRIKVQGK